MRLLHDDIRNNFVPMSIWNGSCIMELSRNPTYVLSCMSEAMTSKRKKMFDWEHITSLFTNNFALTSIERLIGMDRERKRYDFMT